MDMQTSPHRDPRFTCGTETTVGWVPHLLMRTGEGQEFEAPVMLVRAAAPKRIRVNREEHDLWFAPKMRDGQCVFALPGGGEILDPAAPPQARKKLL